MAEVISGPSMVLTWTYVIGTTAGTSTLAADYRTCTFTPSIAYVDASAGADTWTSRMTGIKDATVSIELVAQTGGTALYAALQPGQMGTLTIQPEGTATGKRKITFPSYCDGAVAAHPYNDILTLNVGFSVNNSASTYADTVN
jgi:hypothetical protein